MMAGVHDAIAMPPIEIAHSKSHSRIKPHRVSFTMPKRREIELFTESRSSMSTGYYQHTMWMRQRVNGLFTLWVHSYSEDISGTLLWEKDIATPERFVEAFLECVDQGSFDKAGIDELYHFGLPKIRQLDSSFADRLAGFLIAEYYEGEIPSPPDPNAGKVGKQIMPDGRVVETLPDGTVVTTSPGGFATLRTLSSEAARREHGHSWSFIPYRQNALNQPPSTKKKTRRAHES